MADKDIDSFRYLWFKDRDMSSTDTLRFFSQVFGSGAASLITAYLLRHHSHVIKELGTFPDNVVDMIANGFYVDDGNGNARYPVSNSSPPSRDCS